MAFFVGVSRAAERLFVTPRDQRGITQDCIEDLHDRTRAPPNAQEAIAGFAWTKT